MADADELRRRVESGRAGLGRLHSPDERDKNFPMQAALGGGIERDYKYWWPGGYWGDQGYTPQCVGYAASHWLSAGTVTQGEDIDPRTHIEDPTQLYIEAQKRDAWPGTCVDTETECLTKRGWLDSHEIEPGDELLGFDMTAGGLRWALVQKVHRHSQAPYRIWSQRGTDIAVTDNHRWLVTSRINPGHYWNLVSTTDLRSVHSAPRSAPFLGFPETSPYTDDFVRLAAWVVTEGHYRPDKRRGNGITINKKKDRDRVAALMERHGVAEGHRREDGTHAWELSGDLAASIRQVAPERAPTTEFLTSLTEDQLNLFIQVAIDADGNRKEQVGRKVHTTFAQKRGPILDAMMTACTLAGIPVSRCGNNKGSLGNVEVWTVGRSNLIRARKLTPGPYLAGPVWCPQSELGTFVARRNGTIWITGNSYDGTSVRGVMKYLQELGYVQNYYWAMNADEVAEAVLSLGPVIIGIPWTTEMFYPDEEHHVIRPDGNIIGGHALLVDGYNHGKTRRGTKMFRLKNSWGRSWGNNGFAYIRMDHLDDLMDHYGEACIGREVAANA